MPSKRQLILTALQQVIQSGLSGYSVERNQEKAQRGNNGLAIINDGDIERIGTILSMVSYSFVIRSQIDILTPLATDQESQELDRVTSVILSAIRANRTLGGLAEYVEAFPIILQDIDTDGGEPTMGGSIPVVITYSTPDETG